MLIPMSEATNETDFFFIPSLETYQKWASTLICCHHLWMPALLIFGIKVSSLCCLSGVGLLWSPDQRRVCPEMTLTESQATKETCFIYLVHTVYNTWLGLHRSDRLWHLLDWWGGQLFAAWQRLSEGVLKKTRSFGCHSRKPEVQLTWERKKTLCGLLL